MSKTNETMQPEAVETGALKMDVTVRPIAPKDNLIGFANVTFNDSFVVEGFRVCTGDKGIYINMPSTKDSQGNWRDTFKPITAEARRQLTEAIAEGYGIAMEKMQAMTEDYKPTREAMDYLLRYDNPLELIRSYWPDGYIEGEIVLQMVLDDMQSPPEERPEQPKSLRDRLQKAASEVKDRPVQEKPERSGEAR